MGKHGCKWVLMGALGCRGLKGHKSKSRRGHLWSCRPGFGRYGRGNFPGHDVFCVLPKMINNECRWVMMVNNGSNWVHGHGGREKTDQKEHEMTEQGMFCDAWSWLKTMGR